MPSVLVTIFLGATFVAPSASAQSAQPKSQLEHFFEGTSVTALIDLPATHGGIDVFANAPLPLAEFKRRVAADGVAVKADDVLVITRVKVKKTLIEFRLKCAERTVRVNLRYKDGVPQGITPGPVMAALVGLLEFPFTDRIKNPSKRGRQA